MPATMPASRRKTLPASRRRRRQDEGEEEESVLGDFVDDSLSEGSAVSNGDDEAEYEGSDSSGDERDPAQDATTTTAKTAAQSAPPVASVTDSAGPNGDSFKPSADTKAMLHGLSQGQESQEADQLQFEDLPASTDLGAIQPDVVLPKVPPHETTAQRARREHQEYVRQRNANPAFVPTRGGFFLHDDRSSSSMAPSARPFGRGRGRGYGPPVNTG